LNQGRTALETRIATVALALVLVVVGLPTLTGWIIDEAHCCITMDVCHPVQAVNPVHGPLLAPAPAPFSKPSSARDAMLAINDGYRRLSGRLREAPDSPPPKA